MLGSVETIFLLKYSKNVNMTLIATSNSYNNLKFVEIKQPTKLKVSKHYFKSNMNSYF